MHQLTPLPFILVQILQHPDCQSRASNVFYYWAIWIWLRLVSAIVTLIFTSITQWTVYKLFCVFALRQRQARKNTYKTMDPNSCSSTEQPPHPRFLALTLTHTVSCRASQLWKMKVWPPGRGAWHGCLGTLPSSTHALNAQDCLALLCYLHSQQEETTKKNIKDL